MTDGERRGEPQGSCLVYSLLGALVLAVFAGSILGILFVTKSEQASRSEASFKALKERYAALSARAEAQIQRESAERQALEARLDRDRRRDTERARAALKRIADAGIDEYPALARSLKAASEGLDFGAGFALSAAADLALRDDRIDAAEAAALLRLIEAYRSGD